MFINAERLQDVMEDVRRLEREKERITQSMSGGMGTTRQGQHLQYSMRLYEAIEAEKVLEKYIAFEQSHTTFFAPFSELVRAVQRAVDALQNQVQFNAETGLYSVAKTFAPAMKSLQKSLNEARGIDPKLDAQLEEYLLFKVAYKDSSGKEQAMWILEKDGVRVPNSELEAYLKRTADYQDEDKYTILTLEELNEKIMKAWQDKTYYMDGKVYSGAAGSILQASAYVEDWEGQLAESGIMSALSGVGLGAAIARGSKTYKGGSGAKKASKTKVKETAEAPKKGGETVAGHALQKHAGRNPDIWGKVKGNSEEINKDAMKHLEEILNAPGDFKVVKTEKGISFLEKQLLDGRGVRLNMDGSFKGFID